MKKFFANILAFLGGLFTNLDNWIHNHIQPSIEFIQKLKSLVDSPVTDIITALIPGELDNVIVQKLKEGLAHAIDVLAITQDIVNEPDWSIKIQKLLEYLKTASPAMRNAIYKQLASEMAKYSAGGKEAVKGHSVDLLTQLQYSKLVEGVETIEPAADTKENADASVEENTEVAAVVIDHSDYKFA